MDEQHYWWQFFWAGIGFLWVWPAPTFETVRILETTSTGRALILDRGIFEGLQANDFALFYQKQERPGHLPQYRPVLKAEAIKVGDKISFWLAHESINSGILRPGGKDLSMVQALPPQAGSTSKLTSIKSSPPPRIPLILIKKIINIPLTRHPRPLKKRG